MVDTGLHAKRWTRQQAIDYGIEASEVERYVVFLGTGTVPIELLERQIDAYIQRDR